MSAIKRVRPNFRRGVYVIPTSLTLLNIFFGFRTIIYATRAIEAIANGQTGRAVDFFETACLSLLIAAVFDTFDGLIARQLNATSDFGKEYDSLADVVTFGAAPAVLVYAWGLQIFERLGGGIAFLFLAAVSLRLARFNVMTGKTDYRYFVGLPSPAGALTVASMIFYAPVPVSDRRFAMIVMLASAGDMSRLTRKREPSAATSYSKAAKNSRFGWATRSTANSGVGALKRGGSPGVTATAIRRESRPMK